MKQDIQEIVDALNELAVEVAAAAARCFARLTSALESAKWNQIELVAAVEYARADHQQWVHIYRHTKKKRTRKKYEKKILQHWRNSNGLEKGSH